MDSYTIKSVDKDLGHVTVEFTYDSFRHPSIPEIEVPGETITKRFGDCPLNSDDAKGFLQSYLVDFKAGRAQEAEEKYNKLKGLSDLEHLVGKKVSVETPK